MLSFLAWFQGRKSFSSVIKGYKMLWCVGSGRESFLSVYHPWTEANIRWGLGLRICHLGALRHTPITSRSREMPSKALHLKVKLGVQRSLAHVLVMWDIALYSIALNHLGRKFIPFSLPSFLLRSRNKSQLGATMSLTANTF